MKYLITNSEFDQQITQIKKQIKLSMDGIISDSMKAHGIVYKKNYGVSIPRIREIAKSYSKSHDLAQRLWLLDVRETKILATLLQPVETFTRKHAATWLDKCSNIELIEQACMNLYQYLPFAIDFSMDCIQSVNIQHKLFGYSLLIRISKQLSSDEINTILQNIHQFNLSGTDHVLYNAMANCLTRLARNNKKTALTIYSNIQPFEHDDVSGKKHIFQLVKQELIFLGYLDEKF